MDYLRFKDICDAHALTGLENLFADANRREVNGVPDGGQTAVAEFLDITRAATSKWQAVPLNHLGKLCRKFGGGPERYRPDLFAMPDLLKRLSK